MNLVNPRPPSCSSCRDESIATKNASNGARTKPHAPPEVHLCAHVYLTRRRRKTSPPPDHRPPPPVTDTGDSPATRSTRPSQLSESTRLTRLTDRLAGLN
uniref:Uncharacterized protein n=2 Tax=Brassica oleracea TaxID=3712 RepID=A0A0D3DLM1_BRAOL|nr:unnamed protein product [Brassica oleracea]